MRSLRRRLIVYVGVASGLFLLVACASLYVLIRRAMIAEFDRGLVTETQILAMEVELVNGQPRVDLHEGSLPYFQRAHGREYFQLWGERRRVLQRSTSLGRGDLPFVFAPLEAREAQPITLPGEARGRQVVISGMAATEIASGAEAGDPSLAEPAQRRFVLAVARSTHDLDETLSHLRLLLLLVGSITTLATLAMVVAAVRTALKPVDSLAAAITAVEADRLSTRLDAARAPVELRPIVNGLNHLLARLDDVLTRERALTADVAHELRTPLHGLRAKLEVTLARTRTPEAYAQTLRSCLAITITTQSLVENLLTLSRLDTGQFVANPEPVPLISFLSETWEGFTERAAERGLKFEVSGDELLVVTDRARLRQVLNNLFDNAVSYADAGGRVEARLSREGAAACLQVRNTGSHVAPQDAARVFDRFWRGDDARTDTGTHCGLGLALVRRLTGLLGHDISVTSEVNGWFCVSLRFTSAVPADAAPLAGGDAGGGADAQDAAQARQGQG